MDSRSNPYLLDLSGRSKRKAHPYQPHQAFSILYWKPPGSPLRQEVDELWNNRHEDGIRETLSPFLKETAGSSASRSAKLVFHMAVMRWKVSNLGPNELATLQSWIDEQRKSKEQARVLPWSQEAEEYGDPLFAENTYIQGYVRLYKLQPQTGTDELHKIAVLTISRRRYRRR